MTIGTYPAKSLAEARETWRDARIDVQHGRDPSQARNRECGATDFKNVAEEWLKRDQAKNRSRHEVKRILDKDVMPAWGHRQVAEIGRPDVLDLIDGIVDRGAVILPRRVQAHLHRLFRWCVGRGIIETNPASNLPKPGSETRRERVLSDEEMVIVWRGAEQLGWPFGIAIRLLLLTGARREEIGQLRWSEIDLDRSEIKLASERTKAGNPHTVPLSASARTLLAQTPRVGGGDLVFTMTGKTPVSGWSRAKSRLEVLAPIAPWRIHDLRRTLATGLQRLGIGLQVVEAVLGHVSGSRAGCSRHLSAPWLRCRESGAVTVTLEEYELYVAALDGDYKALIEKLRSWAELSPEVRGLIADILEDEDPRKRLRVGVIKNQAAIQNVALRHPNTGEHVLACRYAEGNIKHHPRFSDLGAPPPISSVLRELCRGQQINYPRLSIV